MNRNLLFRYYLPLEKSMGLHFPSTKGCLCAKFPSVGSGEEVENRKSLQTDGRTDRQTDRRTDRQTTDDRRSEKLTCAFSSSELKIRQTFRLANDSCVFPIFIVYINVVWNQAILAPPPHSIRDGKIPYLIIKLHNKTHLKCVKIHFSQLSLFKRRFTPLYFFPVRILILKDFRTWQYIYI